MKRVIPVIVAKSETIKQRLEEAVFAAMGFAPAMITRIAFTIKADTILEGYTSEIT
ncbi:MAG: hypothetical protein WBF90_05245 [Rivularia sp. (in: cyanobacteria)]|jgi:hypothetical protein